MSVIRAMTVVLGLEALKIVFFGAASEAAEAVVGKENVNPLLDALLVDESDKRIEGFHTMMKEISSMISFIIV